MKIAGLSQEPLSRRETTARRIPSAVAVLLFLSDFCAKVRCVPRNRFVVVLRNTASDPQALEGSRFTRWQLYRLLAGGSRERLDVRQFYGPLYPDDRIDAMGKTLRGDVPGSRLLLTDRAAIL
jgi:hypothetical protein